MPMYPCGLDPSVQIRQALTGNDGYEGELRRLRECEPNSQQRREHEDGRDGVDRKRKTCSDDRLHA